MADANTSMSTVFDDIGVAGGYERGSRSLDSSASIFFRKYRSNSQSLMGMMVAVPTAMSSMVVWSMAYQVSGYPAVTGAFVMFSGITTVGAPGDQD